MLDRDDAIKTARDASEAVRGLNHATLNHRDYSGPEISDMVNAVTEMVERLPQLIRQLAEQVEARGAEGRIYMDDGRPVLRSANDAGGLLRLAGYDLADLIGPHGSLTGARSYLSHMGAVPADDGDE